MEHVLKSLVKPLDQPISLGVVDKCVQLLDSQETADLAEQLGYKV